MNKFGGQSYESWKKHGIQTTKVPKNPYLPEEKIASLPTIDEQNSMWDVLIYRSFDEYYNYYYNYPNHKLYHELQEKYYHYYKNYGWGQREMPSPTERPKTIEECIEYVKKITLPPHYWLYCQAYLNTTFKSEHEEKVKETILQSFEINFKTMQNVVPHDAMNYTGHNFWVYCQVYFNIKFDNEYDANIQREIKEKLELNFAILQYYYHYQNY